jgi:hypothetical protein
MNRFATLCVFARADVSYHLPGGRKLAVYLKS